VNDNITGITCSNTTFDTAATYGVRFKALSSYTGTNAFHRFVGCGAEISGLDGFEIDDSQVQQIAITGWSSTLNQNNGINLLTGTHIQITGGQMANDNLSAGSYSHITVNGATHVTIVGVDFLQTEGSIPYNVSLTSGDYVTLGPNNNSNAATGDFYGTGAVSHYMIITGTTDNTSVGPHIAISNDSSAWDIQDVSQTLQIHNYSNSKQAIVLNASTDTVSFITNGVTNLTIDPTGNTVLTPTTYSSLPGCISAYSGALRTITDATTNTFGATINAGSGNYTVLAQCGSSNGGSSYAWTVH